MTRIVAWAGLVAQALFVAAWLVAAAWQGPDYSPVAHTISDMYAVTAPHGWFLVVVITVCGVATILYALLALWPSLAEAGWTAMAGCVLLALSIYGIGDALTPIERQACRSADPGCLDKAANFGGQADAVLSTIGILLFVAAMFFLAAAMRRTPRWANWAWPVRWVGFGFLALLVLLAVADSGNFGGLVERLLAAFGAAAIAATAVHIVRSRDEQSDGRIAEEVTGVR